MSIYRQNRHSSCGSPQLLCLFAILLLLDLPEFLFKLLDGLADQVDHFSVGGAALVPRNIVQFIVKLAVNAQTKVLILFFLNATT